MDAGKKNETFWRGVDCFNRREFFECHEVLEEIWLEESEPDKPFYQGLIQVAAGFHQLVAKNNPRGAASLLERGKEKLEGYPASYHGIDLARLRAELSPWLERLTRGQPTDQLPRPRIHPAP
ncbi:MAG: DUF309 domain-containing protein [Terriglobia bacterium]